MSWWPKLIQGDSAPGLLLEPFRLGCRAGRNENPELLRGVSLPGKDAKREEPRAKDTHMAGPNNTTETPGPAAPSERSLPGLYVTSASKSPPTLPFLFFSLSQFVLALLAPRGVLANISCFLISSYLNKNEKHREHNVNCFHQRKDKQLHHISKCTETSSPILTIFINPLIKYASILFSSSRVSALKSIIVHN